MGSIRSRSLNSFDRHLLTPWLNKTMGKKEKERKKAKGQRNGVQTKSKRVKKETNQAWDHFCGLLLMSSHSEEARPQLMGQIPEHYTKFRWRYSTIGFSISPGEEKRAPPRKITSTFWIFSTYSDLKDTKNRVFGPTVMNRIKGSALQENTMKNCPRGGGKDGHLSLIQIGKHLRALGILSHVSGLRNTLAPSVSYYDPERNFSPRLFRNHTIAQSQQLARLCVSEPTRWISQALPWQEWQCLHWGSSATTANLILTFSSSSSFSPLPLTARCSSSRQPQQPSFPSWFFEQGFPWLDAATSSKLLQTLQWLFLCSIPLSCKKHTDSH